MRQTIALAFIFVGVASLILFTSTDVFTLFARQHTFVNISFAGNDISCVDCHHRIQNELNNSAFHKNLSCEDCHRFTGTGITFASGDEASATPGKEAHAAYTPRCLDCHGGSGTWIDGKFAPPAPAFNETGYGSDVSAHKPLVKQSLDYNLSFGENEACLACHTNYSIKFGFKRPEYFDFYFSVSGSWDVSSITYGDTNTTPVNKSESGAKHEFKAINQIKCEDCHLDVWNAANHPESNAYGSTKASHVCWKWGGSFKGRSYSNDDPMHNVSKVGMTPGYENITDYCLSSCHKPKINSSATIPPVFENTVHAAYRLSCYHCHNDTSTYTNAFWNKPKNGWDTPGFHGDQTVEHKHYPGIYGLDDNILSEPLFLHAETCISCKRGMGVPSKHGSCGSCHRDYEHPSVSEDFQAYTEPNNTIYMDSTEI